MKKYFPLMAVLLLAVGSLQAQRFAYVNTDLILDQMEDYTKAQEEVNKASEVWRTEINTRRTGI